MPGEAVPTLAEKGTVAAPGRAGTRVGVAFSGHTDFPRWTRVTNR